MAFREHLKRRARDEKRAPTPYSKNYSLPPKKRTYMRVVRVNEIPEFEQAMHNIVKQDHAQRKKDEIARLARIPSSFSLLMKIFAKIRSHNERIAWLNRPNLIIITTFGNIFQVCDKLLCVYNLGTTEMPFDARIFLQTKFRPRVDIYNEWVALYNLRFVARNPAPIAELDAMVKEFYEWLLSTDL